MKKLVLSATNIPKQASFPDGGRFHHRDLLEVMLKNPPPAGFDLVEMRARFKVLDKIEATEGNLLELEDAEFKKLHDCMTQVKWNFMHRELDAFCAEIEKIQANGDVEDTA